ncbi:MAG TPA: acetoacetate--CoA ligase [Vicinamibacterales bacterium]|jgi:acetoacetyl-CoA synthetase
MARPLWTPSADRIASANLTRFHQLVRDRFGVEGAAYADLHHWSIARPENFWTAIWDFCGIRAPTRGDRVADDPDRMRPGAHFFPGGRLNFAENLLRDAGHGAAIIFSNERGEDRTWSFDELRAEVAGFAAALRALGVRPGDRVAGYVPNLPETIAAALGAAAVGAVWSSCSPDFGVQGVLDRFGQIEPKVLLAADGYFYGGKTFDSRPRVAAVLARLPSVERAVIVPYARLGALDGVPLATSWESVVAPHRAAPLAFEQLPFNHPVYILYSSGTTGVPKCIVHGAGGTLIQHAKEHQLHCDIRAGDRVFYFTTCGWMMWNWLVSVLASSGTILLYDGSPFHPDGTVLFDFADRTGMTLFGTSAKYIDAVAKAGLRPRETHRLESIRTMTSTGSPLMPESFEFVYRWIKEDMHLASMSGGTDIISCFVGGDPTAPVWTGELQAKGLGMNVDVFDEQGHPVRETKGELVCTKPFPSMPVSFWNDPDGHKYRAAYFERFPGVWTHGDYVELTAHGGMIIYGRSDAVLNPGGVRIGTAEIYRQVEQLPEILESLVIGQQWDNDERIVLFVRLREGSELDEALTERIRRQVRENATPRHVPARIVRVTDIPRTKSGKIVELAVRDVVHGREVRNLEALANPEALEQFKGRAELER